MMMTTERVVAALCLCAALAGCDYLPFGYTPAKEIAANPAAFEGREVKLKGTVVDVMKLPVLGQGYLLEQDGAQVFVATQGELPAMKAEVALKGTVRSAAIIGGKALGTRVDESKRLR
jgi:hypothetical protein